MRKTTKILRALEENQRGRRLRLEIMKNERVKKKPRENSEECFATNAVFSPIRLIALILRKNRGGKMKNEKSNKFRVPPLTSEWAREKEVKEERKFERI